MRTTARFSRGKNLRYQVKTCSLGSHHGHRGFWTGFCGFLYLFVAFCCVSSLAGCAKRLRDVTSLKTRHHHRVDVQLKNGSHLSLAVPSSCRPLSRYF